MFLPGSHLLSGHSKGSRRVWGHDRKSHSFYSPDTLSLVPKLTHQGPLTSSGLCWHESWPPLFFPTVPKRLKKPWKLENALSKLYHSESLLPEVCENAWCDCHLIIYFWWAGGAGRP
jgi:hypothetical protein